MILYVKGLACGLWDAWWPFWILLSRGAGGEAGCEGSLDKWCHLILQGNAGRSCLLLWNAKNVASPKHGACHTYNAKWTTKDPLAHFSKDSKHGRYASVYGWLQNFNTIHPQDAWHSKYTTDTYTHTLTGLHLDRRWSALNVHLFESSLNFLQLQQDLFHVPNWEAWPMNFWDGHMVSTETVSMVTGHVLVRDDGLAEGTTGYVSVLE